MSKTFSFKRVQHIQVPLEEAWDFFSNPANLPAITPDNLQFKIISAHHGAEMYSGQLIEYIVRPFLGISFYWMTEITHVEPYKFFIDEQRYGPYAFWHHQHHFRRTPEGVEMTDIVHYRLPFWKLGDMANSLFVRRQLKEIFDYRYAKVDRLYPGISKELLNG